jgi:hypothetical protein
MKKNTNESQEIERANPGSTSLIRICGIVLMLLFASSFTGQAALLGDVNNDSSINIVDALLIAQYYVGLNPSNFDPAFADVNRTSSIDIVDALLIAQYYVGLITEFPGDYTLVWSDEFTNGISSDWIFETGNGSGGWGNNELEYYRQENASVTNGELVITAKKESYGGFSYTSARMKTEGRKYWTYGKIEARLKVSVGQGLWPAFWMLGENITSVSWPACGEIDIFEHINREAAMNGTIHWDNSGHASYGTTYTVNVTEYHVYSIEWDSSSIKWFVDGTQYLEANIQNNVNNTEEFHRNFFILFNFAVGGNWPGSPDSSTQFPAHMYVDYVRVYQ